MERDSYNNRHAHLTRIDDVLGHEGRSVWVIRLQFERCQDVCGREEGGQQGE